LNSETTEANIVVESCNNFEGLPYSITLPAPQKEKKKKEE